MQRNAKNSYDLNRVHISYKKN